MSGDLVCSLERLEVQHMLHEFGWIAWGLVRVPTSNTLLSKCFTV
jgi:hypothetical protein